MNVLTVKDFTQELAQKHFRYDPETGDFYWKLPTAGQSKIGDLAGSLMGNGYVTIQLYGVAIKAHRLAWIYMHGEIPEEIDHINGIRNDNRLTNLRNVNRLLNCRNHHSNKRNTSGFTGVHRPKKSSKWKAQINVAGKKIGLGTYDTPEAAHAAYLEARSTYHKEVFL